MSDKKRVGTTASGEKSADGPSGIGKSTMLALALGMVEPAAGHVTVAFAGGVAIDAASLAPGAFAYVPQGDMLMSGSVREVVAMSERGSVDDGRVWRACEAACADDFLRELPEGGGRPAGGGRAGLAYPWGRCSDWPLRAPSTAMLLCCCLTSAPPRLTRTSSIECFRVFATWAKPSSL